jgi:pseudouridine-5'-phosphate glycosidase
MGADRAAEDEVAVAPEVKAAIESGSPIVALESTIVSHGLPRPRNLEVALELEAIVRRAGAVPATVGVVAGEPIVGLDERQLEILASSSEVAKAGTRELPPAMAAGRHAATTVASTALLARRAGIRVFATGGIGGVHRGAAETYDESSDLTALSRTPITVVCAGVKSILDVGATLERLETLAVTVVGYRTLHFPGFYLTDSGHSLDWQVESPDQVVSLMRAADRLDLQGAVVVANPLPPEHQLDPTLHDRLLEQALDAAAASGVRGQAATPFLLEYLNDASGGASLEANIWAVKGNVALAAEIAAAWSSRGA